MDIEVDLEQEIDQLIPHELSATQKIDKIDLVLKKNASIKVSKKLKRKLQNRRAALKSRMRKSQLIDNLTENKNDMQGEMKAL